MTSHEVLEIYNKLESKGIRIWLDGGWAVDALLGKITRIHTDLDLAVEHKNLRKFKELMESLGYKELERDENKKWDFVLADSNGHELDVHSFSFDEDGEVIEEDEWAGYKKDSLYGKGVIDGNIVRCASYEHLVRTHDETKRELKEKDYKDIAELNKKFASTSS